ncbi:quinone oxidoreductase family protein [Pseudosporangium ferrugineum]|uniref:NADPH:quinone reductase-like Zn-dependent oxidoreductase n=1 Tax=Pseudosporangium ferrugineum TaxID=439699 RepID=A0A2T0S3S9_9ACTN|nr:zinc-binding dehydrogenase [Pseudosporangium ferrugineum]PRY28057.1 NADPH:quinone reductase-like Zn-dependent oxidoreductase [Pseudosporangium ferrugineum]
MKAIQMSATGGPDVLEQVDLPTPRPGEGAVLIRVEAAGVNFMDLMRRKGMPFDIPTPLPFVPGAEVAGTVIELGDGVENVAVGDRVFGVSGDLANGGWAELTTAGAAGLFPIPPGLSAQRAAGLTVVGVAAAVMLIEAAKVTEGETVFVPAAAGGLGGFAVQIAKALGATVIAGAGTEEKRRIALELGADHAVDYHGDGWPLAVKELTGGTGVDVALEAVGPRHLGETISILAPFGRLISYGSLAGYDDTVDPAALASVLYNPAPAQTLTGFNVTYWLTHRPQAAYAAAGRLLTWLADGTVTGPRITSLPLAEAAEALSLLENGKNIGKVVLVP